MNNRDACRGGRNAASGPATSESKIALGDIDDLRAYVHTIAKPIVGENDELDEYVAEGIALAYQRFLTLGRGASLKQALSYWLESRLRDYWRTQHREWRRNSRGATNYSLHSPTGLAWEHDSATTAGMPVVDGFASIESRLNLELVKREEDLRDSRIMGRFQGVPSAAALATGVSREIWATIDAERELTDRRTFRFLSADELD